MMNIIVHYPNDHQAEQDLKNKVAILHAQAIVDCINAMQLSSAQKKQLIDAISHIYSAPSQFDRHTVKPP